MFTGLIAEVGTIAAIERGEEGARLRIEAELAGELAPGDSVAVSGVCLTAVDPGPGGFAADVMNQTLNLSALGDLEPGGRVNLEPALRASDRLGGHIVQGHVDGTAGVIGREQDGFSLRLRISLPAELSRYVIPQGSITIEGVSLTVADCGEDWAEVALIPETRERTNLGTLQIGTTVNIECDVIAKYVERMVSPYAPGSESHTDR